MAAAAYNSLESPLSMVEKTAKRILPVITQVQKCLIKEKRPVKVMSKEIKEGSGMADVPDIEEDEYIEIAEEEDALSKKIEGQYESDMRSVLGYLN